MPALAERRGVRFASGDDDCAAWHYPGTNGACVVMAGGLAVDKEPATDRFAQRFHAEGCSVLAFDFRHFGESGGRPRQVAQVRHQLADWDAAVECAARLPEVSSVAIWGFSLSGGHVLRVAARHPELAAAIAQAPLVDGAAALPNALRHTTTKALIRLLARAVADAAGGRVGRPPRLVPLVGDRGTVALLSSPDAQRGPTALDPEGRYPDWQRAVAASAALRLGSYRPGTAAKRVACPLLIVAYEDDAVAPAPPAIRAAQRAPRGELARLPGNHYGAFLESHESTVAAEVEFLRRHALRP